jgi:hypothetical protein
MTSAALTNAGGGAGGAGGRPSLVHAWLELLKPPTAKGSLTPGPFCGRIDFQFNPKELTVTKAAKWVRDNQKKSKSAGVPEYRGPDPSKLSLEMYLAATDAKDQSVVETVEKLFSCCVPHPDSQQKKKEAPPLVIFHWGEMSGLFVGFIASVAVKYTLFTPSGRPIRATATVSIEEMAKQPDKQNPTSGGTAVQTTHTVVIGDTLTAVAYREYGDPNMWRGLAEHNAIDDPMRLRPGTALLIPAVEDLRN